MQIFTTTLGQMISLFSLIAIGFLLVKVGVLKKEAAGVLSKLENNLFIPALILNTFLTNFTIENLNSTWQLLLFSLCIELVIIPLALLVGRLCERDKYKQGIVAYGIAFSNFGFMGIAVVKAMAPMIVEQFKDTIPGITAAGLELNYVIFTLVLWTLIYAWATPTLLIPVKGGGIKARLKSFCNPMFICIVLGMVLGPIPFPRPEPIMSAIGMASDCMSPVAMLLTGITIASVDIKAGFKSHSTWISCALRLLVIPGAALGVFCLLSQVLPFTPDYYFCAFCTLAMPLGLSPVVIPAAYGKDTTMAATMALVSHLLSVATLPLMFMLMEHVLF